MTNKLVSCSHDRNAYVWVFDEKENKWNPIVTLLLIQRGATSVKWSPSGAKFAVSSGAKVVRVCHFEPTNNWWISDSVKRHRSTINAVDWSPNSHLLVTGACDMKCRIVSAFLDEIDDENDDAGLGDVFPDQFDFGSILCEFDITRSWVNCVAWSPSMTRLAFASHNSTVTIVDLNKDDNEKHSTSTILCKGLPYLDIAFLSTGRLLAAGFGMNPVLYSNENVNNNTDNASYDIDDWVEVGCIDKKTNKKDAGGAGAGKPQQSAFSAARSMFGAAVDRGHKFGQKVVPDKNEMWTTHKNTITSLCLDKPVGSTDMITKFSACSLDGRVVSWDLSKIEGITL